MDTLNVILNEAHNNQSFDLIFIISVIKDIATIIAIILGLYWGQKGLKKLLLDDIVKSKISDLHKSNKKVVKLTNKIISEIYSNEDVNRPVTVDDITLLKKHSKSLIDCSYGSSKEVSTFCFFLYETIKKIEPSVTSKTHSEIRMAGDFYSLVHHSCVKLNQFSSNIIDIPKRIKLEPYNEISKSVRKFLKKEELFKVKGIQFGINLDASSYLSLLFSNIINRTTTGYIYKKQFYQLLRSNTPVIYELYVNKIYFPVLLETREEIPMMGKRTLHLVRFDMKQSIIPDNKEHSVEFFYSNINPMIKFMESLKLDQFTKLYFDASLDKPIILKNDDFTISKLADETIKIVCKKAIVENYFNDYKKQIVKKLKTIKKSS